ncbi:putative quinone oxidoreductase [Colletotrichum godetiae]|uniref:Quinone oxidoreductase n=1 Tax=Colletotrichum godetiae TaxID=1209918 RepID=A0AAJ0ES91_9PEZI|nr:putative quinone oxidoreductase [Colletotrichum godetiae]KAK1672098.1 putative quinone oxidoreductase [Colletotrichum godetiae]
MKEAIFDGNLKVEIHDTSVPTPGPGQVLIQTTISGTNPKDWKPPKIWIPHLPPMNHGDDIAGFVESVGEGVLGFKKGDRVAAFHEMNTPHGSYAEYSIAWAQSTFLIPEKTSFEEAATIPLAAMTAALALYQKLNLPLPWNPAKTVLPLLVNGGATAVGAFAIKLATLSNIHPIIAVAGSGSPYVETLISKEKGDVVIDYRKGEDHVLEQIRRAARGQSIINALDGVSEEGTVRTVAKALAPGGKISVFLRNLPSDVKAEFLYTMVGTVHASNDPSDPLLGDKEFGSVFYRFFGRGLEEGWFTGHPYEVLPEGLSSLEEALKNLEAGKVSAKKYLLRIEDTK